LTSTTNSLLHLRTSYWDSALKRVEAGETMYLSCSSETAIPQLADLAGVNIVDRARVRDEHLVRFVRTVGDVEEGTHFRVRGGSPDLHLRGVELAIDDAEVLAVDQADNPVLTLARRGNGSVIVCALPLELLLAAVPDAYDDDEPTWSVYRAVAAIAGLQPAHHPDLTVQNLQGPLGGITVIANHSSSSINFRLEPPETTASYTSMVESITIDAHGTAMLPWQSAR
jgi:beta-galactosidase